MSSHDPLILIVNDNDEPIGDAPRDEAQRKGLVHRISDIMVEDPAGRILLQKRAASRDVNPNRWTTSVGGHVDTGEDYLTAAKREMQEEIGLSDVELQEIGYFRRNSTLDWRQMNRFYTIYKTIVPADTEFHPNPEEVSEVRWFTVDEVKGLIEKHQGQFTGGLIEVIKRFYS